MDELTVRLELALAGQTVIGWLFQVTPDQIYAVVDAEDLLWLEAARATLPKFMT